MVSQKSDGGQGSPKDVGPAHAGLKVAALASLDQVWVGVGVVGVGAGEKLEVVVVLLELFWREPGLKINLLIHSKY